MANFSLVTVSKGEIKSVDGFIKAFNSVGHNMKALSVSAYNFMTCEDKDLSIEFGKRVRDELHMSKATLSNLRTSGWLYSLSDVFEKFSYTNVIFFKKNVEDLKDEEGNIDMYVLYKFIVDLTLTANSKIELKCEDLKDDALVCSDFLATLSQSELKNVISKYNMPVAEAKVIEESPEESEPVEEVEAVEEVENVEEVEEAHQILVMEEDLETWKYMLGCLRKDMKKDDLFKTIEAVKLSMETYK